VISRFDQATATTVRTEGIHLKPRTAREGRFSRANCDLKGSLYDVPLEYVPVLDGMGALEIVFE